MPRVLTILSSDEEAYSSADETRNSRKEHKKSKDCHMKSDKKNSKANKTDTVNKKAKQSKGKKSAEDPVIVSTEFISAARTITRCIDLWCEVNKVIRIAQMVEQDEASKAGELEEDESIKKLHSEQLNKYNDETHQDFLKTYRKVLQVTPGLSMLIQDPKRTAELAAVVQKMNETIHGTRSINATKLRLSIGLYAAPDPRKAGLDPPIINSTSREEMGLKHPVLAQFICPADQLERFMANPEETRKLLKCGKVCMRANNFPAVFWSGDRYSGENYDAENMCKGLFRGYMLIRIARHIFIGPTSALNTASKKGSKSCNAVLHDMTTVEPEYIGYVCVQTCFGISSMSCWNEKDGEFSYLELYRLVVSFIPTVFDTEWRDDLLKWWNLQLFGNEKGRGFTEKMNKGGPGMRSSSSDPVMEMSMVDWMQAQMVARMAAKSKATDALTRSSSTRVGSSEGQVSPPHFSDNPDNTDSFDPWPAATSSHHCDGTSTQALSELFCHSSAPSTPAHQHATPQPATPLPAVPRRLAWQAGTAFLDMPRCPGLRSADPSPDIPRRPGLRSGDPSPNIPHHLARRFHRPVVVADPELEEPLTPLPVEKTGQHQSTKGKGRKHTTDDNSASDAEVNEPSPVLVKKGGKSTGVKGKKRAMDELNDDEAATNGDHPQKPKYCRTRK